MIESKLIAQGSGLNVYELDCPGCQAVIEVGVPARKMGVAFTHDICGTLLIQNPGSGMFGSPALVVVSST